MRWVGFYVHGWIAMSWNGLDLEMGKVTTLKVDIIRVCLHDEYGLVVWSSLVCVSA